MLPLETHFERTTSPSASATPWQFSVDEMVGIDPDCLGKLMQVGYLAVCRGRFAEAKAIFEALATLRPASEIPLLGLTVLELSAGNLEQARKWLDAAALLGPNVPHTLAIAEVVQHCLANPAC